jgi:YHS domain-containing protein
MHSDAVFTVSASTPKVEHRGRTYYFCCPECAKHFAEHPGDFVK